MNSISIVLTPGLKNIRARVVLVRGGLGIIKDITVVDAGKGLFVSNPSRVFTNSAGAQVRTDVVQLDASVKAEVLEAYKAEVAAAATSPALAVS